jgi:hypothetical protein
MILVNRDSIWNIFMSYEQSKAELDLLKMDTTRLRFAISTLRGSNDKFKSVINNYETVLIPLKDSINMNLENEVELQVIQGRKKYVKGIRDGSLIGIVICVVGGIVFL